VDGFAGCLRHRRGVVEPIASNLGGQLRVLTICPFWT
jgi:hypothetical protein